MEASQLFLGSSPGASTHALTEGVPAQSASKQTDTPLSFLDLIKAGLNARLNENASEQGNSTAPVVDSELSPEAISLAEVASASESIEADPELTAEMLQSLDTMPDSEITLCQSKDVPAAAQINNSLLETLFSQNLVQAERLQSSSDDIKPSPEVSSQQAPALVISETELSDVTTSLVVQNLDIKLAAIRHSGTEASQTQTSALQVTQSSQNSLATFAETNEAEESNLKELPGPQLNVLDAKQSSTGTDTRTATAQVKQSQSSQNSLATFAETNEAEESNLKELPGSQLTVLDAKQSSTGTDTRTATAQVKQSQFDYWQNLFCTLTQGEGEASDLHVIQSPQNAESVRAPLAWLLKSLDTNQQNLSQRVTQLLPFLNQQGLSFATSAGMPAGQSAPTLQHSITGQEISNTPNLSLTGEAANLSLETQDFTRQQESNGFLPRASELGFATQMPRSEASAELAQTKTNAALLELGERFALVKQLSQRIQLLNQRDRSIELSLEPAHLGKLTLRLQQSAQQLNLQIFTELPLAKDLIESHLQQLRNQLQAQGFDVQHIQVQLQADQQFSQNSSSGQQQESQQPPSSSTFDLFQSEEFASEADSEPGKLPVDTKFNYQINTLV